MNAPKGQEWRASRTWPPAGGRAQRFYLQDGNRLRSAAPAAGQDRYTVDYSTTSGPDNRWAATYGGRKVCAWDDLCIERPMLHARTLGFTHPVTGTYLEYTVPPPADMDHLLRALREGSGGQR